MSLHAYHDFTTKFILLDLTAILPRDSLVSVNGILKLP